MTSAILFPKFYGSYIEFDPENVGTRRAALLEQGSLLPHNVAKVGRRAKRGNRRVPTSLNQYKVKKHIITKIKNEF